MGTGSTATDAKVFVLGLDGATWDNILPLARAGHLPTFARYIDQGSWGSLRSTIPCVTPPAWASFLTGASPARHGILDFTTTMDTELQRFVTLAATDLPKLWDMLAHCGRRSVFLNVPFTYPPASFDGILVPGPPFPLEKFATHPPELAGEILRRIPGYTPELDYHSKKEVLSEIYRAIENRRQLGKWLMDEETWDFFMLTFIATDRLHHKMWHSTETVSAFYRRLDEILGEILNALDSDTYVIFVSDHGFTSEERRFHLNQWLAEKGFLKPVLKSHRRKSTRYLNPTARRRHSQGKLSRFLRLVRLVPGFDDVGWTIDLARTKAFSSFGYFPGIYVNLRGRYEWGSVSPEDYESVRDELISALSTVRTPDGEPLFGLVARREDMFDGPHMSRMPDIICEQKSYNYCLRTDLGVSVPIRKAKRPKGTHAPNGLFLVKGPGIRPNHHVVGTDIQDVVPLVLFLMGLPQPSSVEGALPREVLDPEYFGGRQVSVMPVEELGCVREHHELDDGEQEAIRRELEGLGYL